MILPVLAVLAIATQAHADRIETAPWNGGWTDDGAGVFVDLTAIEDNLVVTEIGMVVDRGRVPVRLRVWRRTGSYVGFDGTSDGWTVVDQVDAIARVETPTPFVLNNPISIGAEETAGFLFEAEIGGVLITGHDKNGEPPQTLWENLAIRLFSDVMRSAPFSGHRFDESCFSGYIVFDQTVSMSMLGTCPGPVTFDVNGATSGGYVGLAYAFGTGLHAIPQGRPCSGVTLGLDQTATLIGWRTADENGNVSVTLNAPPAACGRVFVQAIDIESCALTNVLEL